MQCAVPVLCAPSPKRFAYETERTVRWLFIIYSNALALLTLALIFSLSHKQYQYNVSVCVFVCVCVCVVYILKA